MASLENVEKLRQYANVSYDEAKEALDACDGDVLEAIIYLEKKGRVEPPKQGGKFTTDTSSDHKPPPQPEYRPRPESFGRLLRRFFSWLRGIIRKGNHNLFEVNHNCNQVLSLPVTLLVILIICAFWVTLPMLIVGLFFGFRYQFRGSDLDRTGVNSVMDTVANAANDIKTSFQSGCAKDEKHERKDSDC